jgi:hypothetical protein
VLFVVEFFESNTISCVQTRKVPGMKITGE